MQNYFQYIILTLDGNHEPNSKVVVPCYQDKFFNQRVLLFSMSLSHIRT